MRSGQAARDDFTRSAGEDHAALVHGEIQLARLPPGRLRRRRGEETFPQRAPRRNGIELQIVSAKERLARAVNTARPPRGLEAAAVGSSTTAFMETAFACRRPPIMAMSWMYAQPGK